VTGDRRGAPTSAPLSTKILVGVGVLCVLGGFGIAGWQRLTEHDESDQTSTSAQIAHQYLPDVRTLVLYLAVVVAAILAGAYLLVRARRRRSGL
jgi:hypothetical protein